MINATGIFNEVTLFTLIKHRINNKPRIKQKEAVGVIANAGYRDHTTPLFAQLKILPIDQLIKLNNLKFMHSYFHNSLPFSFRNLWD